MPLEARWNDFFSPEHVVEKLVCRPGSQVDVVELGCGYGTFTVPTAHRTSGFVHAIDIEPALVDGVRRRAESLGLSNLRATVRDFAEDGTGLPDASVDRVMAFNILHIENPAGLLRESLRVLRPHGLLSIVHWLPDSSTPRGPPMDIRPTPNQCVSWANHAGFRLVGYVDLSDCAPFHFGLVLCPRDDPVTSSAGLISV